MEIKLPYGKNSIEIEIPKKNIYFIIDKKETVPLRNPRDKIKKKLKRPVGLPPLSQMVSSGDKIVIISDDITRPTPQNIILPTILNELNENGVSDKDIEVIIALGTHRKMSEKEIEAKFGKEVIERVPVINHDYDNPKELVNIGKTNSGVPVSVNKKVYNADFVIGIGNIVPHCYTGWGGGGKIILPGVCGEKTTSITHLVAGKTRPITKIVGTLDNWIKKEVDAVALKSGLKLIVNTILNQKNQICDLAVGEPIKAFQRGVDKAKKIFLFKAPGYADIVVVSSHPADIDFWQAVKPLTYGSMAVKPGGTIVLITPCPDRISPTHPIFKENALLGYEGNLRAINKKEVEDLVAGGVLLHYSQIREHVKDIICYSDGLTEDDKNSLGIKHASSVEEAMEMAFRSQGKTAKVGILKCGETIPIIN